MIIAKCNLDQLIQLESILFTAEWDIDPFIPIFYIQCNDELYRYKIDKICGKYRIITY